MIRYVFLEWLLIMCEGLLFYFRFFFLILIVLGSKVCYSETLFEVDDCQLVRSIDGCWIDKKNIKDNCYLEGRYLYKNGRPVPERETVLDIHAPGFQYDSFSLFLRVKTDFDERKTYNIITGGYNHRWLSVNYTKRWGLRVQLNDSTWSSTISDIKMGVGDWVELFLIVSVDPGNVTLFVNGEIKIVEQLPLGFYFDTLRWYEADKVWSFTDSSFGGVFKGNVEKFLVYDYAVDRDLALSHFTIHD